MKKQTKIILGVVLAIALAVLGFSYLKAPGKTATVGNSGGFPAVTASDWQQKADSGEVTFVEYADFQCPACGAFNPLVQKLKAAYAGRVTFVFRHFPLAMHPNALPASLAAEAAGAQGKFFEMSDILFSKQAEWSDSKTATDIFVTYATVLGLDTEQFKKDMVREDLKQKIVDSYKGGIKAKVGGTPSFFINGVKVENPKGNTIDEVYAGYAKLLDVKLGVAPSMAKSTSTAAATTTAN
jgi:protein-disulfide isomerase